MGQRVRNYTIAFTSGDERWIFVNASAIGRKRIHLLHRTIQAGNRWGELGTYIVKGSKYNILCSDEARVAFGSDLLASRGSERVELSTL